MDVHAVDEVDPVVLQSLLARHRAHLANTHKEVHALKTFIKTLEGTNETLRHEVSALKLELAHFKDTEVKLLRQLGTAESAVDRLTGTIHKQNQDHALAIAEFESQRRLLILDHKFHYDRICAQLEATQQPTSSNQPLPWKRVASVADHPAHVLREVVLEDLRREERILQRNLPIVAGDNSHSGMDSLSRLLAADSLDSQKSGHDTATWLVVLKRIFQVLKERRGSLGVPTTDAASDFFVRSRNALIGEWGQLHREILRGVKVIVTLRQALLTEKGQPNFIFAERQLDLISSILGDADTQCHRVKQTCFTDVDRLLYNIDINKK